MMVQLFSKMGRRFVQILLCIVPGMFFNHFQYFMVKYSEISYVKCGWIHYISYILVYCPSRYKYKFPFLETNGYMSIDDNRVEPLYKHVFPPALAPGLSFVGLPGMVSLNRNSFIGFQSLTSFFCNLSLISF